MNKLFEEFYDLLVDWGVATPSEIELVCCINGHSVDTLNSILYATTGFRSLEQWKEMELNEYDEPNSDFYTEKPIRKQQNPLF